MKTRYFGSQWLVPVLGIGLVAATAAATRHYSDQAQNVEDAALAGERSERLCRDLQLSRVLRALHEGEVQTAAQQLDLLLCGDVLRTDKEVALADAETQAHTTEAFRRIAIVRPRLGEIRASGSSEEHRYGQTQAQRILDRALVATQTAQVK